jgi:protein-disulfide isomerase
MSEPSPVVQKTKKFELSPSIAILVSGVLIAGAIVFVNLHPATPVEANPAQLPSAAVPPARADEHIIGSPTAPIVLIEYSDFQCPFCQMIYPTIKQIVSESKGQVAWVMRNYPLVSIHPQAKPAALAAECLTEQLGNDGFWKFADTIFANQDKLSPAYYEQVAVGLGVNKQTFESCVSTEKYADTLNKESADAEASGALVAMFLLESFYAVMVIYSPIYITSLGIPLAVYLSVIMPIALIPLILLPYELGRLADKRYGEKEILIIGLLVMVLSLLAIIVTESSNVLVWVGILLFSRIGAACTETMIFTYFFKKVDAEDVSLTALFGNIRSLATISIAALGVLVSPILVSYPGLMFLLLALMILYGITYIIPIKDTR